MKRWMVIGLVVMGGAALAQAQTRDEQSILGPGLYVFQTRITEASCGDADRTGFVSSYYAAIDGVPGARNMVMRLIDSQFWARWEIEVEASGTIKGQARNERVRGTNRFEVRRNGSRYTGTGTRRYRRGSQQCSVTFDALLRRIDT